MAQHAWHGPQQPNSSQTGTHAWASLPSPAYRLSVPAALPPCRPTHPYCPCQPSPTAGLPPLPAWLQFPVDAYTEFLASIEGKTAEEVVAQLRESTVSYTR